MGRIKIKHGRPKEIGTRRELLAILAPAAKVTRMIHTHDAIITITSSDKDADTIFSPEVLRKLGEKGFNPIISPELKFQKTVILTRLDDLIYDNSLDDIKTEINRSQTWAKVQEVFKFPNSRTLKVTFDGENKQTNNRSKLKN